MSEIDPADVHRKFLNYLGQYKYNRFLDTLKTTCIEKGRLMYWQENIWRGFSKEYGLPLELDIFWIFRTLDLQDEIIKRREKVREVRIKRTREVVNNFLRLGGVFFIVITLIGWVVYSAIRETQRENEAKYQEALNHNSIDSFLQFLDEEPPRTYVLKTRAKLRDLLKRDMGIHVEVKESYAEASTVSLPYLEDIARICSEVDARDLSIYIHAEGFPLSATYRRDSLVPGWGIKLYTGALLEGKISIKVMTTGQLYEKSFQKRISPPSRTTNRDNRDSPSDAPFLSVYQDTLPSIARNLIRDVITDLQNLDSESSP